MDEETRKLLTEYLGECWDADKRPGGDLPNRTFTTPDDMMALKDKLVEKGEFWGLDSFLDWADNKWDTMPDTEDNYPGNFIDWLMNPTRFCALVGEWQKARG